MAIIASNSGSGGGFEPVPEGVYTAICYSIVDVGEQFSEKFNNSSRKVLITFELPDETIEIEGEEKPRAISKEYTLSLNEKSNLRKDLTAWRGKAFTEEELKGFDLENILGKGCQIQIINAERNGKTYANIASIMGLPKGMKTGKPYNPTVYFSLEDSSALDELNKLPSWVQNKVRKSLTYQAMVDTNPGNEAYIDEDDSLPF